MNKTILIHKLIIFLAIAVAFAACEKATTAEKLDLGYKVPAGTVNPIAKTPAYYESLKAYKKSSHSIAFGWFGGWTASGPSKSRYLTSIPDSLDFVNIWGGWGKLTPAQIADMREVQQKRGTRVTFTIITDAIGSGINGTRSFWPANDSAAVVAYAKAIVDTVNKYGYDGFDIDFEPDWCGCNWTLKDDLGRIFVKELGKYLGPKSGTGKLLLCDGSLTGYISKRTLEPVLDYFDYFLEQAYGADVSSLNNRFAEFPSNFPPAKYVVAENFEKTTGWRDGGNLLQMAAWNPSRGRKGGIGTYHMEYEYANIPDYKYLRQAIQMMNPAAY